MGTQPNSTLLRPPVLILIGIPGMEDFHGWFALPLCVMYCVTVIGNCTILFIIKMEASLHQPMYFFLAMLAFNDLILSSAASPKMLGIFWFNSREIDFDNCLIQMFFIHTFSISESAILLAMSFDRYVAICSPLRYASILTNDIIAKIGLAAALRAIVLVIPCPVLITWLSYCKCVIPHTYCEHMSVLKLACGDTTINRMYGMSVVVLVIGFDLIFIVLSYVMILRTVFSLSSKNARLKALGTCAAHTATILFTYVPALFSFLTHRIGRNVPPHVHIILANLYLLIPPLVNPVVYSVKTKQIRERLRRFLCHAKKI
ncbi:olfactory receptor 52K1-like [Microcaecilia unicolor]|uniref:Olfactory receptor n=1 Tax=Microcaecilia unicolor TaxID=1415580 RepID=A0A6P7XRU0_9AMPH|nr:olfactory receptor 52K1-like [Microcaecilia unicolor]